MRCRAWFTSSALLWADKNEMFRRGGGMHLSSIDFAGEQERSAIDLIHKPMQSEIRLHGLFFRHDPQALRLFLYSTKPQKFFYTNRVDIIELQS